LRLFFIYLCPVLQLLLKILEGSENLFSRYGIKSITMDDVARELGISKKTLYQFVNDKNDLVEKTLEFYLQRHRHTCEVLTEDNKNPIDAMLAIGDFFCQQLKDTSPALMFDLRKYHSGAFHKLGDYKQACISEQLEKNMERGIKEGFYRPDVDTKIIPRLYMVMADAVLESPYFPRDKFKFEDVVKSMLTYHICGIATPKGIEYLNKQSNKI
jgi:AcrR family transcriptional regulator